MASSGDFGQSAPVSSPNMFRRNKLAAEEMVEYLPIYHYLSKQRPSINISQHGKVF